MSSTLSPRWYPYFDIVVELAWSMDPESYASSNVDTGKASRVGHIKGDDPDKKGYPSSPECGMGVSLTSPHKRLMLRTYHRLPQTGLINR